MVLADLRDQLDVHGLDQAQQYLREKLNGDGNSPARRLLDAMQEFREVTLCSCTYTYLSKLTLRRCMQACTCGLSAILTRQWFAWYVSDRTAALCPWRGMCLQMIIYSCSTVASVFGRTRGPGYMDKIDV